MLSLVAFAVDTLPDLSPAARSFLYYFEVFCVVVFTLEYVLRIYVAENPFRYMFSFYGIIAYGDVRKSLRHHRKHALRYNFASYFKDLRNLIIEFGPSEILDVLAVRPFFMYLMPKLMGEFVLGTFVGKMIADLVFFIPAIIMYEVRKKHLSD